MADTAPTAGEALASSPAHQLSSSPALRHDPFGLCFRQLHVWKFVYCFVMSLPAQARSECAASFSLSAFAEIISCKLRFMSPNWQATIITSITPSTRAAPPPQAMARELPCGWRMVASNYQIIAPNMCRSRWVGHCEQSRPYLNNFQHLMTSTTTSGGNQLCHAWKTI